MSILLAIDPGISTGCAVFQDGYLLRAHNAPPWDLEWRYLNLTRTIIEVPHVYPASKSKGDPNDLIKLAVRVGEYKRYCETLGPPVELVEPAAWKGQLSKEIHHARGAKKVTSGEAATWQSALAGLSKKAQLDVSDAVCLGLWALGRLPLSGR